MIDADQIGHERRVDDHPVRDACCEKVERTRVTLPFRHAREDDNGEDVADIAEGEQRRETVASEIALNGE